MKFNCRRENRIRKLRFSTIKYWGPCGPCASWTNSWKCCLSLEILWCLYYFILSFLSQRNDFLLPNTMVPLLILWWESPLPSPSSNFWPMPTIYSIHLYTILSPYHVGWIHIKLDYDGETCKFVAWPFIFCGATNCCPCTVAFFDFSLTTLLFLEGCTHLLHTWLQLWP